MFILRSTFSLVPVLGFQIHLLICPCEGSASLYIFTYFIYSGKWLPSINHAILGSVPKDRKYILAYYLLPYDIMLNIFSSSLFQILYLSTYIYQGYWYLFLCQPILACFKLSLIIHVNLTAFVKSFVYFPDLCLKVCISIW